MRFAFFLLYLHCLIGPIICRRHILSLKNEGRKAVLCTQFGFLQRSFLSVSVQKLEGQINHVSFTLDKAGTSGVTAYLEAKPSNCFHDELSKFLHLLFDTSNKYLVVYNNDAQLQNLIFEASASEMDTDQPVVSPSLVDRIHHALKSLRLVTGQDKELAANIHKQVMSSERLLNMLHSIDLEGRKQYPIYLLLREVAKDNVKEKEQAHAFEVASETKLSRKDTQKVSGDDPGLQSVYERLISMVSNKGSLKFIPCEQINGIWTTNFTVYFPNHSEEGLYNLYFHNCAEIHVETGKRRPVNLTLRMVEKNEDSYLSAGQQPLPILYSVACCAYLLLSLIWFLYLYFSNNAVFRIHYLMLAVVVIKAVALGFHGINYFVIGKHGVHEEGWAVMYYITHIIRGALLFITILLIGAGWAFIKHMLTIRERNVFLVVIPLQILANVATVIIEESETGAVRYAMWKEIFIFVDLACCGAILFPVVWSIRHLQAASQTDGKAAINLRNLRLFRHFYILVICYVYFTRVVVYLMTITVPYSLSWLVEFFKEIVTYTFFIAVGYKFRPVSDNPYLFIANEDDDEDTLMERIQLEDAWSQSGVTDGVTRLLRPQPVDLIHNKLGGYSNEGLTHSEEEA